MTTNVYNNRSLSNDLVYNKCSVEITKKNKLPKDGDISSEELSSSSSNSYRGTSLVVPQDSLYGWVVVLASFFVNVMVDGIVYSFGIFLNDISKSLNTSQARVTLVGSLLTGFYMIVGPFVSVLINKYGFRIVTISGAILASLSFLAASMASSVEVLMLTFGVCGGISFGLMYIPSIVTIGFYFEKWRAVAMGVAVCGSGIGTFLFAPISGYLIATYGWRISIAIQGGMLLLLIICGCAYKPVRTLNIMEDSTRTETKEPTPQIQPPKPNRFSMYEASLKPTPKTEYLSKSEMCLTRKDMDPLLANKSIVELREKLLEARSSGGSKKYLTPYCRDDIFFQGSLMRLPQYKSQTSLAYHAQVTNQIEKKENIVVKMLTKIFDVSVLKSPSFLMLAFSGFLTTMGMLGPFMYIKNRATDQMTIDAAVAVWLVSTVGVTNTVGRVLCGVLTSIPGSNALLVNNIALTICGLVTICSGYSPSVEYQFAYAAVFGITISSFSALRTVIVVDLIGLEKLTNSFGLLMLFQGLAAVIGAPVAGIFVELTGSYDFSFYLSGALVLVSAIMCYPIGWMNAWEKNRKQKVHDSATDTAREMF